MADAMDVGERRGLTFAANLLEGTKSIGFGAEVRRLAQGLALAGGFGFALGMREGGVSLVVHAVGAPLGLAAVAVLGTPALLIGLLHVGAPIDVLRVVRSTARTVATAGLMLGGLAPLAALMMVTSEDVWGAATFAWMALAVAGALALRTLFQEVGRMMTEQPGVAMAGGYATAVAFGMFASLLAARVWLATLPVLLPDSTSAPAAQERSPS